MMQTVTISVPETLQPQTCTRLRQEVLDAAGKPLVLRGSAGIFCHGLDFAVLDREREELARQVSVFTEVLDCLQRHDRPTMAVVDGEALGGGLALAAVCDLVLGGPDARFGLPELLYGFLPGIILPYLLPRVNGQVVRRMCVTAESVNVQEACRSGLVDICIEENPEKQVSRIMKKIARVDGKATGQLRQLLAGVYAADEQWQKHCVTASLDRLLDENNRKALSAFMDEGIPPWSERDE